MGRTRVILLFALVLLVLVAPVVSSWCASECIAKAISQGCAHSLKSCDEPPVEIVAESAVEPIILSEPLITNGTPPPLAAVSIGIAAAAPTPLRI